MSQLLSSIISALPFKPPVDTLIKRTGRNILLPFYHTVSNENLPHICNLYPVRNIKLFVEDLDFLLNHYQPVSIDELYKIVLSGESPSNPVFHLTFDDGLKEFYSIIAPILEEKKIPATVFVNTAYIDNKDMFYRYKVSLIIEGVHIADQHKLDALSKLLNISANDKSGVIKKLLLLTHHDEDLILKSSEIVKIDFNGFLEDQQPYMTTNQIKDLIKRRFSVGSHGVSHPLFKLLSLEEQKLQVEESFKLLRQDFLVESTYFSFPFNDEGVKKEFFNWFEQQRYQLSFGISGLKDDYSKSHLHRIPMEGTLKPAESLIKTEYLYYILKSIVKKNRIVRL